MGIELEEELPVKNGEVLCDRGVSGSVISAFCCAGGLGGERVGCGHVRCGMSGEKNARRRGVEFLPDAQ